MFGLPEFAFPRSDEVPETEESKPEMVGIALFNHVFLRFESRHVSVCGARRDVEFAGDFGHARPVALPE